MKINIVLPFFAQNPTGGPKVIYEYANYFALKGNQVNIYFLPDYCVPIRRIPKFVERGWRKYIQEKVNPGWFEFNKAIRRLSIQIIDNDSIEDGDIVIATAVETAKPVAALSESKGKKVYFIQDFENWRVSDEEVFDTYNLEMTNIVVSGWLKKIIESHSQTPVILIGNAVNTEIFHVTNSMRDRINHSVVFHYRKEPFKGCEYALEAINILYKKYHDLKVFVISANAKTDGLPDCCELYYNQTPQQVAEINNKAQVFMCSSINEGFGLPGLEAMACGCALVSTAYEGVFEYAVDKENAYLCPVKDAQSLAKAVSFLFDNGRERERLMRNGIITAQKRSLHENCIELEKIFTGLII